MTFVEAEISSQPELWRRASVLARERKQMLPAPGERVAFFGCGTSLYIAQAAARSREAAGQGESDAFPASEMPTGRRYALAIAISRSGTTTEVLERVARLGPGTPVLGITADAEGPLADAAAQTLALPFADERSVVQTRFATCALALLRAHAGQDLDPVADAAERALGEPALPWPVSGLRQLVFLGRSWSVGLAHEAALKAREAAGAWSEAYPALEYRHGPISLAGPGTVVCGLAALPAALDREIEATGARLIRSRDDPMVELVRAQRLAVALALARGLDPDQPRHLSRSVVLEGNGLAG